MSLAEKARTALGMFGGIDILVLNAGITQRSRTRETDESVYRRLMEVNFFAPEAMARAVLPSMLAQKKRTLCGDLQRGRQVRRAAAVRILCH